MAAAKDAGENVRALVEKSIVETRARYAQAKSVAEETSAAVEASYGAARDGVVAFNVKTIEAIKADADANFDLFKSLAAAKSVSELVTLQTEFARKRFEDATSRSKELAELARKVADRRSRRSRRMSPRLSRSPSDSEFGKPGTDRAAARSVKDGPTVAHP